MLEGKMAIVTGGAGEIGSAIAKELSLQGADVVICSRNKVQIKESAEKLSSNGKRIYGVVADVSSPEDCQKLIDFAYSLNQRIDILVNCAGTFGPIGPLETTDPSDWVQVLATNVLGAVYCSKLVIPYMKKQGAGKIVNLAGAGVGGPNPLPRFSGYFVSKSAVVAFTENLAAELGNDNIQVNAIAPGAVASELTLSLLKMDKNLVGEAMFETSKKLEEGAGTSSELAAKLVAFLVSEKANHITGRLISAKWDKIEELEKADLPPDLYKLRRIDDQLFKKK